jgi:hypothetical protein
MEYNSELGNEPITVRVWGAMMIHAICISTSKSGTIDRRTHEEKVLLDRRKTDTRPDKKNNETETMEAKSMYLDGWE